MEYFWIIAVLGAVGVLLIGGVMSFVNASRINRLERRARDLESALRELESRVHAPPLSSRPERPEGARSGGTPAERPIDSDRRTDDPLIPPSAPKDREPFDLEALVAGRWLNRIGIVAVLIATAFFLKYAFDNQWIGPLGRVAIGLVAGTALILASDWLLKRGYRYFSEGITALGAGVLFLSLYAAWSFYLLVPMAAAFAGMVLVTGALVLIARGRGSERLAALALGAGFLTPGLLLHDGDPQVTLFTYLAVLVAAFLALAWERSWRSLAPIALVGFLILGLPWLLGHYTPAKLVSTLLFAAVFFATFGAYTLLQARRGGTPTFAPLALVETLLPVANALWLGLLLHRTLYADYRWTLTFAMVAMGALHLLAARFVGTGSPAAERARLVLSGLALAFVTVALPVRLEGEWLAIGWAVEAAALVWAGFRAGQPKLRLVGLAVFLPVFALLVRQDQPVDALFLNPRFPAFLVTCLALGACLLWSRRHPEALTPDERQLYPAAGVVAVVLGVWALSTEVWYAAGRLDLGPGAGTERAQQMGLSLLWMLLAGLLIWAGWRRHSKALRFQGLALLGITIVKVFIADLSFLENAYRIASFLVLGIVLLAVSFRYQRTLAKARADDDGKPAP